MAFQGCDALHFKWPRGQSPFRGSFFVYRGNGLDRCGIFVDAGYLIAEGAKACIARTAKRGDVAVDYPELVARLCQRAVDGCGLPVLRIYWYDGAVDGVPTVEQHAISALPDVKLRLGRLSGGRQKGVDALVYRDLSVLARERAIVTAYLLAGDEDLREGVATAQELGVHVTLWGIGATSNQARTLRAEVDRCGQLDDLHGLFAAAPGSRLALAGQLPRDGTRAPDESSIHASARSFARTWASAASPDDVGDLLAVRPRIPAALDAELLRAIQAQHGDLRDHNELRQTARAAFWDEVNRTVAPKSAVSG